MVETEASLPTAVFREQAQNFAGRVYSFLLLHLREFFLCVILVLLIVLFFKVRSRALARRAKKEEPISTNNWFSWEDFEQWRESQKK